MSERLGTRRLWCPETLNGIFAVSARDVVGFGHQRVFIWDTATGAERHVVGCRLWVEPGNQRPRGRISDDGRRVHVMRRSGTTCAIDLATGAVEDDVAMPPAASASVPQGAPRPTADGGFTSGSASVVVTTASGNRTIDVDGDALAAAVSADGRVVAVAMATRDRIDVHDVASGRRVARWDGAPAGYYVAVSNDGALIAAANAGCRIELFDVARGTPRFAGDPSMAIAAVAFARDGRRVVGATHYTGGFVWTRGAADDPARVPVNRMCAFDDDGDVVGAGVDGEIGRWTAAGKPRARVRIEGRATSISWLDGGRALVTSMVYQGLGIFPVREAVIADLREGRAVGRLELDEEEGELGVTAAATRDGRWLASMHLEHVALHALAGVTAGRPPEVVRWDGARWASFSGDGRIAIGGLTGGPADDTVAVRVLDLATHTEVARVEAGMLWWDAGHALERRGELIVIRDPRTLAVRAEIAVPRTTGAAAVSPDGRELAYCDGPTVAIVGLPV